MQQNNGLYGLQQLSIEQFEYGEIQFKNNSSQVHLYKLMPLIPKGKPKDSKISIPNLSCNDSKCKIIPNKQCVSKNYMTIIDKGIGKCEAGDKIFCQVILGNLRKIEGIEIKN